MGFAHRKGADEGEGREGRSLEPAPGERNGWRQIAGAGGKGRRVFKLRLVVFCRPPPSDSACGENEQGIHTSGRNRSRERSRLVESRKDKEQDAARDAIDDAEAEDNDS